MAWVGEAPPTGGWPPATAQAGGPAPGARRGRGRRAARGAGARPPLRRVPAAAVPAPRAPLAGSGRAEPGRWPGARRLNEGQAAATGPACATPPGASVAGLLGTALAAAALPRYGAPRPHGRTQVPLATRTVALGA